MARKTLFKAIWVGVFIFCVGSNGKSYLSIISSGDDRGVLCEITKAYPEPNVMGVAIACQEKIAINDNTLFKEFSLVWAPMQEIDDKKIQAAITEEINNTRDLEETDLWLTAELIDNNFRSFRSHHAPPINFLKLVVKSSRSPLHVEYEISNKELAKLVDNLSDSD